MNLERSLAIDIKKRQVSVIRIEAMMRRREGERFASRERGEMYNTEIVKISSEKHIVEIGWEGVIVHRKP